MLCHYFFNTCLAAVVNPLSPGSSITTDHPSLHPAHVRPQSHVEMADGHIPPHVTSLLRTTSPARAAVKPRPLCSRGLMEVV